MSPPEGSHLPRKRYRSIPLMTLSDNVYPWYIDSVENLCKFFISRASFWAARLRTPSPPWFFGLHVSFHAACSGFLHLCLLLFISILINLLYDWAGNLQSAHIMMNNDENNVLTICNLPANDKNWEVDDNLLSIFWTRGKRDSSFGLVNPIGRPK